MATVANKTIIERFIKMLAQSTTMPPAMQQQAQQQSISKLIQKVVLEEHGINKDEFIQLSKLFPQHKFTEIVSNIKFRNDIITDENLIALTSLLYPNATVIIKHTCNAGEFMTLENPNEQCNNPTLVTGSCGDPSFFGMLHDDNSRQSEKINELLVKLISKCEENKINPTICFVLGILYGSPCPSYTRNDENIIYILITNSDLFDNIDEVIPSIDTMNLNVSKTMITINTTFPLNYEFEKDKLLLDYIIKLTENYKIVLCNQICGSCFKSMWYLRDKCDKNFEYHVCPEQGLGKIQDTEEIKRCFLKETKREKMYRLLKEQGLPTDEQSGGKYYEKFLKYNKKIANLINYQKA